MRGRGWWVGVIVAAVVAVAVLGVLATQLQLSRAKEEPCGTALRIDLRAPTILRDEAADLEASVGGALPPDLVAQVAADRARADELEDRCKGRQRWALLGLGLGGVVAAAAVAGASYRLGVATGEARARPAPIEPDPSAPVGRRG